MRGQLSFQMEKEEEKKIHRISYQRLQLSTIQNGRAKKKMYTTKVREKGYGPYWSI